MPRPSRNAVPAVISSLLFCSAAAAADLVLRGDGISLSVDPARGTIAGIRDLASGLVLAPPPGSAGNFGLDLLYPDKKRSSIAGRDQLLTSSRLEEKVLTDSAQA